MSESRHAVPVLSSSRSLAWVGPRGVSVPHILVPLSVTSLRDCHRSAKWEVQTLHSAIVQRALWDTERSVRTLHCSDTIHAYSRHSCFSLGSTPPCWYGIDLTKCKSVSSAVAAATAPLYLYRNVTLHMALGWHRHKQQGRCSVLIPSERTGRGGGKRSARPLRHAYFGCASSCWHRQIRSYRASPIL